MAYRKTLLLSLDDKTEDETDTISDNEKTIVIDDDEFKSNYKRESVETQTTNQLKLFEKSLTSNENHQNKLNSPNYKINQHFLMLIEDIVKKIMNKNTSNIKNSSLNQKKTVKFKINNKIKPKTVKTKHKKTKTTAKTTAKKIIKWKKL